MEMFNDILTVEKYHPRLVHSPEPRNRPVIDEDE
jgi:hypothetical protein